MKTTLALIAALGVGFAGASAQAAVSSIPTHVKIFADIDNDGVLSGVEQNRAERRVLNYENRN